MLHKWFGLQSEKPRPGTVTGLIAGLGGTFALTRHLSTLLFKIEATDALIFAVVASLLALTSLVAAALPGVRAARIDPMLAMRAE